MIFVRINKVDECLDESRNAEEDEDDETGFHLWEKKKLSEE